MDATLEQLKQLAVEDGRVTITAMPCTKSPWEVNTGIRYGYGRNLKDATLMAYQDGRDEGL